MTRDRCPTTHQARKTRCGDANGWPIVGAFGLLAGLIAMASPAFGQSEEPQPVTVSSVLEQTIRQGRSFVGSIEPVRVSTIGSRVSQRVVAFPVEEGQRVQENDLLAQLRTETLEIQLEAAQADLEARRQELAELENGSRPEEIEAARAELGRTEALRNYSRTRRRRIENLLRNQSASPEELDLAISNAEQAEQQYRKAEAELELLVKGPRKEKIAQAKAKVAVQEQEVRRLKDQLAEHEIRAPFDGYVTQEHTEVGQWVTPGDPIVELIELDRVDLVVNVLEDYVPAVSMGTEARVAVEAVPNRTFSGKVTQIVPRADLQSRSFPVKIRLDNVHTDGTQDVLLKAGMLAKATLPVGEPHPARLVHKDALVLGGQSPTVVVVRMPEDDPDAKVGTVKLVPVSLGIARGSMIEIKGPVEPGSLVVVQGNERLRPGAKVRIIDRLEPEWPAEEDDQELAAEPATEPVASLR